jgi:hypothetical protein
LPEVHWVCELQLVRQLPPLQMKLFAQVVVVSGVQVPVEQEAVLAWVVKFTQ